MSNKVRINRFVYEALTSKNSYIFTVIDIRDCILMKSHAFGSKQATRLFVTRQLEKLEKIGLIVSNGHGRDKHYSISEQFHETQFELVDKRLISKPDMTNQIQKKTSIYRELEQEKMDIESELTLALAEIQEYNNLMQRSDELKGLLESSYSSVTKKAASLLAKFNVWSTAISLTKQDTTSI